MTDALLDQQALRQAFTALGDRLAARNVVGELHVFGGAAMVLAFDARVATRDVDALFVPDTEVIEAAWEVAQDLKLPRSWLNNQASIYVSGRAGRGTPVFDHPNLRVLLTPPEHLLAMKVRAARSARDAEDIRLLMRQLDISEITQVVTIVERFFPDEPLSDRSLMLVEDLVARQEPGRD
ncbi:MAG: hypothetical protein KGN78_07920 [Actinomycetales bacterium]|nr:hypothetical protein [Actinomycetales bacterium]